MIHTQEITMNSCSLQDGRHHEGTVLILFLLINETATLNSFTIGPSALKGHLESRHQTYRLDDSLGSRLLSGRPSKSLPVQQCK